MSVHPELFTLVLDDLALLGERWLVAGEVVATEKQLFMLVLVRQVQTDSCIGPGTAAIAAV
jgi:hypothetical protein